jgi:hypothetical protein
MATGVITTLLAIALVFSLWIGHCEFVIEIVWLFAYVSSTSDK